MMIWKIVRNNLIKWWYVVYTPIVRKIWPTKEEMKLYEQEHPEEFEDSYSEDTSLLNNKNYNATTHSMSGEYGKGVLDDSEKEQLDAILKNNYSAAGDALAQLRQAEEIYERLRREAAEDEAKKLAEIEAVKNAVQ